MRDFLERDHIFDNFGGHTAKTGKEDRQRRCNEDRQRRYCSEDRPKKILQQRSAKKIGKEDIAAKIGSKDCSEDRSNKATALVPKRRQEL